MQNNSIKINIKLTSGKIVSLNVPLEIKIQDLISQLKEALRSLLTESDYYLETLDWHKLSSEKTLADEGIEVVPLFQSVKIPSGGKMEINYNDVLGLVTSK
ncbi:MAG: hypothetical protein GY797_18550 [Deltaproteobacteria bacterium]|nr:hypothetical protein [Deltaproteobacteria bacterium]